MARRPAVFLDRDGTISEEVDYLTHEDQLRLIDGVAEAIKSLKDAGFKVVVITNQAGIARGYLSEQALDRIHEALKETLAIHNARLDAIYYCPHHPTEGLARYQVACECRKPGPGMLKRAAGELKLDLSRSFVVGDKLSDLEAGYAVGCRGILVETGYGRQAQHQLDGGRRRPHHVASNLLAASQWIIAQEGGDPSNE
jgi:D-glycero-D-manno-heptose 1,7-bisphosphate phosphatase